MTRRRTLCLFALGLLSLAAVPSLSFAQDQGGGRGNFDPARFREEMLERVKTDLGAEEQDWNQVLKPKIEKLMEAQRNAMGGRGGGMFGGRGGRGGGGGGRGGDGGGDSQQARSPVQQASRDLRDALENKDTPPDQIAAKLKTLRDARTKARTDLETAQKDIQGVLTPRQEAVLVSMGMLD